MQVVGLNQRFSNRGQHETVVESPDSRSLRHTLKSWGQRLVSETMFRECLTGSSDPQSTGPGDVKLVHAPTAQGDFILFLSFLTFGYYPPLLPLFRPP